MSCLGRAMSSVATLVALVAALSREYGLEPADVNAIIQVESKWDASAVGQLGEIGLLQLRPEYFPINTHTPIEAQLRIGIRHLSAIKARCPHREGLDWVICHNVGIKGALKFKHPSKFIYVKKVKEAAREARIETAAR